MALNITITGDVGEGKTILMKRITDLCIELGINVICFDEDNEGKVFEPTISDKYVKPKNVIIQTKLKNQDA